MILKKLFSHPRNRKLAHGIYSAAVAQSRMPIFYTEFGVPDTVEGRFDMISLHIVLVMRRLKQDHARSRDLSQALFDYMFDDVDQNLREMGIGDLGVGNRIKKMAEAFYGRLAAYDAALDETDDAALTRAIERNVFGDSEPAPERLSLFAAYVRQEWRRIEEWRMDRLLTGEMPAYGMPADDGEAAQ